MTRAVVLDEMHEIEIRNDALTERHLYTFFRVECDSGVILEGPKKRRQHMFDPVHDAVYTRRRTT